MAVVYIVSNNGKLAKDNELLEYSDYQGNITKLLPQNTEQIVVVGVLDITGQAFALLSKWMIPITFLSKNGKYNSRLVFGDSKNVFLRHCQHVLAEKPEFMLTMAKDIVRGKIHNEYLFMQRVARQKGDASIGEGVEKLARLRTQLEQQGNDIETIRGIEGAAANAYFSLFAKTIQPDWAVFHGRSKNPPRDNVNAVLSFVYTLLATRIDGILQQEGLDAGVGSLHAFAYGRDSLVFDLIEEYRSPLCDTLCCSLFNLAILTPQDFRVADADAEMDGIDSQEMNTAGSCQATLLTTDGMRKVLSQFEKKLLQTHIYPLDEKSYTYGTILKKQILLYKQVIGGILDHYMPLVVR